MNAHSGAMRLLLRSRIRRCRRGFASCAAKSAQCTPPSYVPLSARHFPRDERDEKACRKRDGRTFSARFQDAFFRVAHACATRCRFTGNRYRYKHTISIIHHTTAFYNAAAKFFRKQNEVFPQAKFSGPPVGRCVELPPNPPEKPASSLALLRFASSFSGGYLRHALMRRHNPLQGDRSCREAQSVRVRVPASPPPDRSSFALVDFAVFTGRHACFRLEQANEGR